MRIYFIRHGHPNYALDCLTDIGHLQAEACAERLKAAGIQRIFSSSQGRARETAEHTAKKLGLAVEPVDFIRELAFVLECDGEIVGNIMYIPSTAAVEAFDATFPPRKKAWMPSREEFYIYSHSSVVR